MMTQLVQDAAFSAEAVVALAAEMVVAHAVEAVAVVVTVVVVVEGFVEGAVLARFLGFPLPLAAVLIAVDPAVAAEVKQISSY